jgi:outer membrane protein OmpA-like peptidoglycan-associated protein
MSLLFSCQSRQVIQDSISFDRSVRLLVKNLIAQLENRRLLTDILEGAVTVTFAFNPFVEVGNGQVTRQSLAIEEVFFQEIHSYSDRFKVTRLTQESLQNADYIINGIIQYEARSETQAKKYHHISTVVIDLKENVIAARNEVWIDATNLDYTPTPSYQDNPLYLTKNRMLQLLIDTVKSPVGTPIGKDYTASVKTRSLLVEAQTAYDKGNYDQARHLYSAVVEQVNGNTMEAFGGLYATNFKLGRFAEAEEIFAKIVALGAEAGNLPIKLMFESDLTEFLRVPQLRQQYDLWIRQLAFYLRDHSQQCINIIGHTSRTGLYDYNMVLSEQRAEVIQQEMSQIVPDIFQRTQVVGRGSDETIVGSVPDNAQNAIDRRVEFKIFDCSQLIGFQTPEHF